MQDLGGKVLGDQATGDALGEMQQGSFGPYGTASHAKDDTNQHRTEKDRGGKTRNAEHPA